MVPGTQQLQDGAALITGLGAYGSGGPMEYPSSWARSSAPRRHCRRRGMRDPELNVGDGAMGLWKALAEVFPAARHQRCWVQGP
ncbi:transposase [Streptomyces sp. NPDC056192]|uniref:transposase n=1 Tax=Streptomyces sp. NPDC056192 TaxID=3345743 RepID=UPI0035D6E38B